jgi:hypothetical protein
MIGLGDLLIDHLNPFGQSAQHPAGRDRGIVDGAVGWDTQSGAARHQGRPVVAGQLRAQAVGSAPQQSMDLMQCSPACLDRTAAGRPDLTHRFDIPLAILGHGQRSFAEHRAGGIDRIDRVGLAAPAPILPIGPGYLDHRHVVSLQKPLQASPVGPGSLQPGLDQRAERTCPGQQLPVTGRGRGELAFVEQFPGLSVQCCAVMGEFVGIDADHDVTRPRMCCHAVPAVLYSGGWVATPASAVGQDRDGCL